MKRSEITSNEHNAYFKRYLDKVALGDTLVEAYEKGQSSVVDFYSAIPKEKHDYKYGADKWTIKEVLQHQIDTERIFAYRCFRIARHDKTALVGFDQDIYIAPACVERKSMKELLAEFNAQRTYSISLLKSLRPEDLAQIGTASDAQMSARAAAFIIPGHDIWHMEIIKERYLC